MLLTLDSKAFNEMLIQKNPLANAILNLHEKFERSFHQEKSFNFQFVRSPLKTSDQIMKNIPEYALHIDDPRRKYIEIKYSEDKKQSRAFMFKLETIKKISKLIYKKKEISNEEFNNILKVFVQSELNDNNSSIFITNNDLLIKNRLWFESHVPGGSLNIMTIKEAAKFIDLFLKKKGFYILWPSQSIAEYYDKWFWYYTVMRLKLPHYNAGEIMLDALAVRFTHVLAAIDEIGILYHSKITNATRFDTLYHFNYLISLITGTFDNIALKIAKDLNINIGNPARISINNKAGKKFLSEVGKKSPILREHINSYVNYINLIYQLRVKIIHREGLQSTGFSYKQKDWRLETHAIRVTKPTEKFEENLRHVGDKQEEFGPFSEWGMYKGHEDIYISPFLFALKCIEKLIEFIENFFVKIGYFSFIDKKFKRDDEFTRILKKFNQFHLGF